MRNVQDDHRVAVLIDPVTHTPVRSAAAEVLSGVFVTQRMAYPARVVQHGPVLNSAAAAATLLRPPGEPTLRPGPHIELPPAGRAGHAASASRNKCAKRRRKAASSRPGPSSPDPGSSPEAPRPAASGGTTPLIQRLELLYNPQFSEKQRMRASTWDIPRFLQFFDETIDGGLIVPRGMLTTVTELAAQAGSKLDLTDERAAGITQAFTCSADARP